MAACRAARRPVSAFRVEMNCDGARGVPGLALAERLWAVVFLGYRARLHGAVIVGI
jgi:hypothetical protein